MHKKVIILVILLVLGYLFITFYNREGGVYFQIKAQTSEYFDTSKEFILDIFTERKEIVLEEVESEKEKVQEEVRDRGKTFVDNLINSIFKRESDE